MSDAKITQDEMREMFGDTIPMEAVSLIWEGDGAMTIGEARIKLREIAERHKARAAETLGQEFARLVGEYTTGEDSEKEEAWNLIADFAVANATKVVAALDAMFPPRVPA